MWLLEHILPSSSRTTAFSKYLVTLSKNVAALPEHSQTRSCRQRLHVLYIVNDIFHHVNHHIRDEKIRQHAQENLAAVLPELFAGAAAEKKSRTTKRLSDLIQIWEDEKYSDRAVFSRVREALSSGTATDVYTRVQAEAKKTAKELPWIIPATHGDPAAPFFDLPAANLMPHIGRNSTPMRPDRIRAFQLTPGPADDSLVQAMKDFLKDVKSIDDPFSTLEDEGIVPDIDEMGQISYKNEAGDSISDTYYGWSRKFCENMRKNRTRKNSGADRSRSRSNGSSSSASRSPRKRRRYDSSRSRSRSYSRSRSPKRFESRNRAPSRPREMQPRSFSPEPPRFETRPQHHQQPAPPLPQPARSSPSQYRPPQQLPQQLPSASFSPFQPPALYNGMPLPPRPQNWSGPWPPPPPPPPAPGAFQSSFPSLPFPPPPPQKWNHQGHGKR